MIIMLSYLRQRTIVVGCFLAVGVVLYYSNVKQNVHHMYKGPTDMGKLL